MKRRYGCTFLIAALLLTGLTAWGIHKRIKAHADLEVSTKANARLTVAVTRPQPSPASNELVLPANVQAFLETPIYARTNGYLKKWYADIGTKVKAGALLAELETPEVDQQLHQTQAAEAQAAANLDIAQKTNDRWQALLKTHYVSQQEADQYAAQLHAREADLRAAKADVQRLRAMQSFKQVRAPFDGTVTARLVDVGALITDGTSQQLFRLAQAHLLRVYVHVPQSYSAGVHIGLDAELLIPEHPAGHFVGKVVHTSGAIDPASRTLYTEVQIPNPKGELLPGAFGRVRFTLQDTTPSMMIPATALLFRAQGTQVAIVGEQGKVRLQAIKLGRDLGPTLEVTEGLKTEDRVVSNPPDSISDGEMVEVTGGL